MTKYPGFYTMKGWISRGEKVSLLGKPVKNFSNHVVSWAGLWLYQHDFESLIKHFADDFRVEERR